ncbi:MAG: helix-turn-helix transcriptional regulator [Microbacterium sp.]|nr:helix-turn-helix transcriptional regulator [Microbacterium sp.]
MRMSDAVDLVESVLRGGRAPSPRVVDALRAAPLPDDPARCTVDDRVRAAARILALSRLGQTAAASALAEAWRDVPLPPPTSGAPAVALLGLGSAVVEAEIRAGSASSAAVLAERLLANAVDVADPLWLRRCRGLAIAASALAGDNEAALAHQAALRDLDDRQGWTADVTEYMADVGDAVLAFAALDLDRLRGVSARLHRLRERDPQAHGLCQLVDAAVAMLAGEHAKMTATASRLLQGSPPDATVISRFALGLQAFALVRRDEPHRSIGMLRDEEPDDDHLWCPAALRAAAHLRLGDPRSALAATTECMRIRPRHNLRTLAGVLLLRGLAHLHLRMTALGRREVGEAFALLGDAAPISTWALLRAVDQRMLLTAAGVVGVAPDMLAALTPATTDPAETASFPLLTPRERAVAEHLRLPRTFADIAASLHVAPSTVKTQALSIYRKLRVSTRDDAVGLLEQTGYFEQ